MAKSPIDTKTEIRRVPLAPETDLEKRLKALCDVMGAAGYLLGASFVVNTELVVVFQLRAK